MAITYGAQLFESENKNIAVSLALGATVPAGALICIALAGKRSGAYLNVSSVTDYKGNTWQWRMYQSTFRACGVAWTRTPVAMSTSDRITVRWNGTPTYAWKSAHYFIGASGVAIDKDGTSSTGSIASQSVAISGSDWLVFGSLILPNATSGGLTMLNSAISRDDNGHSGTTPWVECFSRNGTTGSTYPAGATLPSSQQWGIVAVSFPALAAPATTGRAVPGLIGI